MKSALLNHRRALLVAVGVALSPTASAAPVALTQEQAVARAVERHPAVEAAEHATEGARRRVDQARTAWLPRLSAEASYRYSGPLPELSVVVDLPILPQPQTLTQEVGTQHNAGAGLKVGWRAFDFFARDAAIDAAQAAAGAVAAEGEQRAAEIAYAVRATYLGALLAAEVETITQRSLGVAQQALADEQVRRAAGIGDDVAVAGAETRVAELEARLVDARQSRRRAMESLALFLDVKDPTAIVLTDRLAVLSGTGNPAHREDSPSLRRLDALEEAVAHQRTSVDRSFWPTLDLFGNVSYQYPQTFVSKEAGYAYAVGAALTWNLFDGDLRRRKRQELDARAAELGALRRAAVEDLERQEDDADSRAEAAAAGETAARRSLDAAQVYLRAAQAGLAAGTGTTLDVRRAEEAVDQANLALARAQFEAAMAHAQKLRALGVGRAEEVN